MLLIDKPKGMSSHDVIDVVRRITGEKRVGHAGTLDPNATGLLIVGVGRNETKKLGFLTKNTGKIYEAEVYLGEERDTDDSEGKVTNTSSKIIHPSSNALNRVLKEFIGEQKQIPPAYSAIKIKGKKAYEIARKNLSLNLKPRSIAIHSIKLIDYKYPILKIVCSVSAGTYIRALARDLGRKLGTYAYLKELRRIKIGEFSVEKAISLQQLQQLQKEGQMTPTHL